MLISAEEETADDKKEIEDFERSSDDAEEAQAEPRPRGALADEVAKQVALLSSEDRNAVENFELFGDRIKRKVKVLSSCFYRVIAIKTLYDTGLMNF